MRAVFTICVLCLALAIYSGHRIVAETHLHAANEPSLVPGASKSLPRDSSAALEQEQRIRASRLLAAETHRTSTLDAIVDALSGR